MEQMKSIQNRQADRLTSSAPASLPGGNNHRSQHQDPFCPSPVRRLRASSGLRHSCAEGTQFSCCLVLATKSVIRVELEQQTYADSKIVHEPGTDSPERISGLQALLEWAPPLPERKLLWHCALDKLLDGTREGSNPMVGN